MDPSRPDSIRAYAAPAPQPEGLAWDGFRLWAASWQTRKLYMLHVTESALVVERTLDAPGGGRPVGLTWDGVSLWLTTWRPFLLVRLNPVTGAALYTRDIHPDADPIYPYLGGTAAPEDLAWDGTHLWMTDWYTGKVYRVDPATMEVVETIAAAGSRSVGLTFHQGALWNGDTTEDALFRLGWTPTLPVHWGGLKSGALRRP